MTDIRSREDLALADLFSRTLRNLLDLTRPADAQPLPTASQILNASDEEVCVSPALFRLLQLVLLPQVLGGCSGTVLYVAAKQFSGGLELQSIQDLKDWFTQMDLGELEVEVDEEKVLVKLSHCITCYRLPATGAALCDFERGLIDGVLERHHRTPGTDTRDAVLGPGRHRVPVRGLPVGARRLRLRRGRLAARGPAAAARRPGGAVGDRPREPATSSPSRRPRRPTTR